MADLGAWVKSAEKRFERYQQDRGKTASDRSRTGSLRRAMLVERGAGQELAPLADQVPPL